MRTDGHSCFIFTTNI